jgi:hypothetical protein
MPISKIVISGSFLSTMLIFCQFLSIQIQFLCTDHKNTISKPARAADGIYPFRYILISILHYFFFPLLT